MQKKIAVIGINASGQSDVWLATVTTNAKEIEDGADLEKALQAAKDDDFDGKLAIAMDEVGFMLGRLGSVAPDETCEWINGLDGNGLVVTDDDLIKQTLTE